MHEEYNRQSDCNSVQIANGKSVATVSEARRGRESEKETAILTALLQLPGDTDGWEEDRHCIVLMILLVVALSDCQKNTMGKKSATQLVTISFQWLPRESNANAWLHSRKLRLEAKY